MKESKLFKSLVATFVVIVLSGPAVVLADTHSNFVEGPKSTVSYADLNLESEEGVRVLYRRLQRALSDVCSPNETRTCYRRTLSNAVDKFDDEDLTRIHAG